MTDEKRMTDESHSTILIVDDDLTNLKSLFDYLQEIGYNIHVAEDGASALKRVCQIKPDLILLDVMMADMDGFEVCRRLKEDESTQDIPVIFMTALADSDHKIKGFEAGAVATEGDSGVMRQREHFLSFQVFP